MKLNELIEAVAAGVARGSVGGRDPGKSMVHELARGPFDRARDALFGGRWTDQEAAQLEQLFELRRAIGGGRAHAVIVDEFSGRDQVPPNLLRALQAAPHPTTRKDSTMAITVILGTSTDEVPVKIEVLPAIGDVIFVEYGHGSTREEGQTFEVERVTYRFNQLTTTYCPYLHLKID